MKKKNGFTLIELLAVIIILGILMIIAIPSVTRYISDSRKNSYVDSAKEVIGSARNLVNSGELEMYDTDATYYIDVNCIKTENAMKSPYGDFVDLGAFVVVTYDGKGYSYYWTSVDDAGQGIKNIVSYDKLDTDSIESDLTIEDIKTNRTLDGRKKVILITDRNHCQKEGAITENLEQVSSGGSTTPTNTAATTILATAQEAGQLNKIPGTNIYIFKGGTSAPPANYVKFNCTDSSDTSTCEDWRIIGIYNGQMKIIRVNSSGVPTAPAGLTSIAYNTTTPNPGWANSSLMTSLNTTYYNTLSDTAKGMIDENGSWDVGPAAYDATASEAYTQATTTSTVESTTHTTPWTGKVGLMSSYEYLYATRGDSCLTTSGYDYDGGCGKAANDWLLNTDSLLWTLSPISGDSRSALGVYSSGYVDYFRVSNSHAAAPAVFLKSSVRVVSGDGTSGNPYILNLE